MMLKSKKLLVLFLGVLFVSSGMVFAEIKVGIINPEKVVRNTTRGKAVLKKLEDLSKSKQAKIKEMAGEIEKLEKEVMSPALNTETRERKAVTLQDNKTRYQRFVEDSTRDFQNSYRQEMSKLQKEIMPIIAEVGKAMGYTLILDVSSSGISYFDPAIEITDQIIEAFNKKAQ